MAFDVSVFRAESVYSTNNNPFEQNIATHIISHSLFHLTNLVAVGILEMFPVCISEAIVCLWLDVFRNFGFKQCRCLCLSHLWWCRNCCNCKFSFFVFYEKTIKCQIEKWIMTNFLFQPITGSPSLVVWVAMLKQENDSQPQELGGGC